MTHSARWRQARRLTALIRWFIIHSIPPFIDSPMPAPSLSPTFPDLPTIEVDYRNLVLEHYNRLSLTGLPERDPGLHNVPLERVFVKLDTEVMQAGVLDPQARQERDRLERELAELEQAGQKIDRRRRDELRAQVKRLEREARKPQIVTQTVAEALAQHRRLAVVGGPGREEDAGFDQGRTAELEWQAGHLAGERRIQHPVDGVAIAFAGRAG